MPQDGVEQLLLHWTGLPSAKGLVCSRAHIPAFLAASTPDGASSKTRHRAASGCGWNSDAALRKMSGAGLPRLTWSPAQHYTKACHCFVDKGFIPQHRSADGRSCVDVQGCLYDEVRHGTVTSSPRRGAKPAGTFAWDWQSGQSIFSRLDGCSESVSAVQSSTWPGKSLQAALAVLSASLTGGSASGSDGAVPVTLCSNKAKSSVCLAVLSS